jgi:hypothetical protein
VLHLMLTVLSIALMATVALATVSYAPTWAPAAQQSFHQVQTGFEALERAFSLRLSENEGVAPAVDPSRDDGGLAPAFIAYLNFAPRPPLGYGWRYGFTSETQLIADGYAGNSTGGLHWFCLYPTGGGASEGVYRGVRRAQQRFGVNQFYVHVSGVPSCGRAVDSGAPSTFPATLSVTLFVRHVPENP